MYNFCIDGISSANDRIIATKIKRQTLDVYMFKRLEYPNIYIPSRCLAYSLKGKSDDSEEITSLRKKINYYNNYLDYLESINGFKSYFVEHDLCVSKEEIAKKWSKEIADKVFALESYIFSTDLKIFKNYLIDKSVTTKYLAIVDGIELLLPIGKNDNDYPSEIGDKKIIWNYIDNGHDFCCGMWSILEDFCKNKEAEYNDDAVRYSFDDFYDQFRDEEPEIQLVRIFKKT